MFMSSEILSPSKSDADKPALLIVEDERIFAMDLRERLEDYAYTVTNIASSASEAMAAIDERRPDIVLMDIRIKGDCDGVDTAGMIRERYGLPVIFLTAHSDIATLDRAKKTRPHGYIMKPVRGAELRTAIEMALFKHRVEQQMEEQNRVLDAMVSGASGGLMIADRSGALIHWNDAATDMAGVGDVATALTGDFDADDVYYPDEETPFHPQDLPFTKAIAGQACDQVEVFVRNERTPNGIHLSVTGRPVLSDDGAPAGCIITFHDIGHLREETRTLTRMALRDGLTGLHNRRALDQHLSRLVNGEDKTSNPFAVLRIEIDGFKDYNERYGAPAGDELLRSIGDALTLSVRRSDFVSRMAGGSFCIVMQDVRANALQRSTEQILASTADAHNPGATACIGVCIASPKSTNIDEIMRCVDNALFAAKQLGPKQFVILDDTNHA